MTVLVLGKLVVDEVLHCSAPVLPGSAQRATSREVDGGGQVWHAARAARRAGARVRVSGWCGDDNDSRLLRTMLQDDGIDDWLVVAGEAVRATVLVGPDGDRAIVSHGGAGRLTRDMLDPDGVLSGVGWVHVDGYCLDRASGDAVSWLVGVAAARGVPISLEPPSAHRIPQAAAFLEELPPLAALLGRPGEVDAALRALRHQPSSCIRHAGADPVTVTTTSTRWSVPVPAATVRTTGAGDRFAGGFIAAREQGRDVGPAVEAGIAAARHG